MKNNKKSDLIYTFEGLRFFDLESTLYIRDIVQDHDYSEWKRILLQLTVDGCSDKLPTYAYDSITGEKVEITCRADFNRISDCCYGVR